MDTILLVCLIGLDVALLGIVYFLGKQRVNPVEIMQELTEERRQLAEIRSAIEEEMGLGQAKLREVLDRVSMMGTEIEEEINSGRKTLKAEMEEVLKDLSERVEAPMGQITKKQVALENVLKRAELKKMGIVKAISRGEQIVKFFNKNVPYEEIIEEIESKKYLDARQLLSKGIPVSQVAKDLNMPESEVSLLVSIG